MPDYPLGKSGKCHGPQASEEPQTVAKLCQGLEYPRCCPRDLVCKNLDIGGLPSTILDARKLKTLGYPTVKPHPSAFPRFDTIPEFDGRTDGQTVGQTDGRAGRI